MILLYLKVWAHKFFDRTQKKDYAWEEGHPLPAMVKRKTVARYGKDYHCNVLIETGTYLGEMIEYQAKNFEKIFSIEIADALYKFSSKRLKRYKNIIIKKGDSSVVLGEIIRQLSETDKVLFWLDGHYSGGVTGRGEKNCPIYEELSAIFQRKHPCVILIDDARCFNGTGGYPTLEDLKSYIIREEPNSEIEVIGDIIKVILSH